MALSRTLLLATAVALAGCPASTPTPTATPTPSAPTVFNEAPVTPGRFRLLSNVHATCVVPFEGPVRCVGSNSDGQLHSRGHVLERFEVSDRFLSTDIDAHLGSAHGCALNTAGRVRCWGSVNFGRRGDGCVLDRDGHRTCDGELRADDDDDPVELEGLPQIVQLTGGWDHTCARDRLGGVWCWGGNIDHESGAAEGDAVPRPRRVGLPAATALSSGAHHNCILDEAGAAWCWGDPVLRNEASGDVLPAERFDTNDDGSQRRLISTMWGSCSVNPAGDANCWGESPLDEGGPLGASEGWRLRDVAEIIGATDYSCALDRAQQIHCWSPDALYTGVDPSEEGSVWRTVALPFEGPPVGLAATLTAACAWNAKGELACWGDLLPGADDDAELPPGAQRVDYLEG